LAPEQQPVAQFIELHPVQTPATQFWFAGHVEQSEPCAPHIASMLPCSQVSPLQQPFGHEVGLHLHTPPTQI
jgi:hypothetical protein